MPFRCGFFSLLILVVDTASLHQVVEGVEGGSVVLNCRNTVLKEKHVTVHWRHNDTRNVYDVINGEPSVKEQDPAYKNRVQVLPEELQEGHVLLSLTDLQLSDRGTYVCFVPRAGVYHSAQLLVKEQLSHKYAAVRGISRGSEVSLGRTAHLLILLSGLTLHRWFTD